MLRIYATAHPSAAEILAIEARAHLAKCLKHYAAVIASAADKISVGIAMSLIKVTRSSASLPGRSLAFIPTDILSAQGPTSSPQGHKMMLRSAAAKLLRIPQDTLVPTGTVRSGGRKVIAIWRFFVMCAAGRITATAMLKVFRLCR